MKYSVIIPMYQAERTIGRCLESLLSQIGDDTELVVINDGSKDHSGEICKKYADKYPAVRYFEKENGGVSSARNFGLDQAQGEYILFVDSDDAVTQNYFQIIDTSLSKEDIDLLMFGLKDIEGKRQTSPEPAEISGSEEIAAYVSDSMKRNKFNQLYTKVFRRSIIEQNKIRFNERISIAEDLVFIFSYVLNARRIKTVPDCIYIIDETNMDSLSRKTRPYLSAELHDADMEMYEALNKAECDKAVKGTYEETLNWLFYRSAYSSIKEVRKLELSKTERKKRIKDICSTYHSPGIRCRNWKTRLISLPIKYKLVSLIDFMITIK